MNNSEPSPDLTDPRNGQSNLPSTPEGQERLVKRAVIRRLLFCVGLVATTLNALYSHLEAHAKTEALKAEFSKVAKK